jgi:hypothetical protein
MEAAVRLPNGRMFTGLSHGRALDTGVQLPSPPVFRSQRRGERRLLAP